MASRKVVFYGDISQSVVNTLTADYGVESVLKAEGWRDGLVTAFREWPYDAAVISEGAPKWKLLGKAIRRRGVPVVTVSADGPAQRVEKIVKQLGWMPVSGTRFVVVTCAKGGVGKSTTAGAIAEILSTEQNKRVLCVDDNPNQSNLVLFFGAHDQPMMPPSEIQSPDESTLQKYTNSIHRGLDILAPDEYTSQGGLTYGVANQFWTNVAQRGYDFVVVDTSPSFTTPIEPENFVDAPLTYSLIANDAFPAVYVAPFTPVDWGHTGIDKTRSLLSRYGRLEWMIPVVTATDALHILENVPGWVQERCDEDEFFTVPYNRGLRDNPRHTYFEGGLFRDPLKHYRPLVNRVMTRARERSV